MLADINIEENEFDAWLLANNINDLNRSFSFNRVIMIAKNYVIYIGRCDIDAHYFRIACYTFLMNYAQDNMGEDVLDNSREQTYLYLSSRYLLKGQTCGG